MLNSGSFDDFLNSLREFESGVSEARISQNRAEIVQQVGQDRLNAFEAGELTLTDLQYSSENFLGFVGYQFGEGILIDTGYYEFDATPGVNDFTGTFTGKNGVNNLDDLKTNVQEQIILDEFQLNLDRIETGLGNAGQNLDDFIGRTVTITDVDGSEVEVELSLTGILSAAHLRGAFGTLDFLLNNNASADEIGTSIVKFLQDFGGFDAPSVAELRAGDVAPLVTDATLTIDQPFEERDGDEPVVVVEPDPVDPDPVVVVEEDTGNNNDAVDDFGGGQGAPAAVLSRVANGDGGFDVNGTDGTDTAFGENGDDVIRSFGGNDAAVGFDGDDFIDVGSGNDQAFGSGGDDVVIGGAGNDILRGDNEAAGNGADVVIGGTGDDLLKGDGAGQGADRFVFAPGDGNDIIEDFQLNVDTLDFLAFDNADIATSQLGGDALVSIGDVTVTLRGIDADDLDAGDFLGGTFGGVAVVDVEEEVEDEVVVVEEDVEEEVVEVEEEVEIDAGDAAADFGGGQGAPGAVLSRVANGEGGFDVNGTDGNDTAFGENGDDVIRSFGGNDAAVGFDGDDFIDVGSGNDQAFGSGGDDVVIGGAGNDILRGDNEAAGNGADVVIGGTGDDLLKGDGSGQVGADRFVFAPGDGNDIIEDFQLNVDTLDFLAFGNADIATSQQGGNAVVSIGDVTVTLRGVDADDLDAGDFLGGTFGGVAVVDVEEEVEDEVVVVEEEENEVVVVEEDTGNNNNNADDFAAGQGTPGAVLSRVANDQGGLDVNGTDGGDGAALGNTGDDVIRTFGGNDAAVGFEGDDLIDVGSGDDRAFGSQGNDVLFGGAGNDILRGDNEAAGNGADVINGGTGDDLLKGDGAGQGADRFVFAPGDGNDTIEDFQLDIDTLDFSAFGNADIITSQQGGNAVVSIGDVTVTLRGVDADDLNAGDFLGGTFGGVAVVDVEEEVEDEVVVVEEEEEDEVVVVEEDTGNNNNADDFAAGQGTPGAVLSRVANDQGGLDINGTDGTDGAALGNTGDDVIRTFGGNDAAVGFEGDDLIDVGSGDDRAFGSQGNDVLFGGAGNDILRGDNEAAGNGADVINGGTGDDLLKGDGAGQGADRFVFAPGDGNDTIEDFQLDIDTLDFSAFGNADIVTSQQGGNAVVSIGDVTVTLRGVDADDLNAGDFLGGTFGGVAVGDIEDEEEVEDEVVVVEEEDPVVVEEEDEVVVVEEEGNAGGNDAGDVIDGGGRRVVTGTDGDDVLNESDQVDAVDINGLAGNDTITGTSVAGVSDLLRGGDGNDTFFGLAGDDLIIPGLGDDLRVVGGAGSDTFFPETNGGNDIFPEFSLEDRLDGTLLDGIEAIEVSRLGNGRTLVEFVGANTTTQISGGVSPEGFVAAANDILVNFPADLDVRVKGAEVANQVDDNDVVEEEEDEVVVVEEEVDAGDAAADFGGGQGAPGAVLSRVANGEGGFDVNGTNGNDTAFGENGDDVIRSFDGNDAAVGFDGDDFIDVGSGNDQAFGSGGDDVVIGGAGNDILRGDNEAAGNGADVIIGGAGDDLLKGDGSGQIGADRFVFAAGDGNDIIEDFQVDIDTLDFSAFGDADIATSQQGGDALVSVGDVNVTLRGVNADDLDAGDFLGGAFGGGSVASAGFDFGSISSGRSTAEQLAFGELDDGSTASQDEPAVIPADILEADILTPLVPDDGLVA